MRGHPDRGQLTVITALWPPFPGMATAKLRGYCYTWTLRSGTGDVEPLNHRLSYGAYRGHWQFSERYPKQDGDIV